MLEQRWGRVSFFAAALVVLCGDAAIANDFGAAGRWRIVLLSDVALESALLSDVALENVLWSDIARKNVLWSRIASKNAL